VNHSREREQIIVMQLFASGGRRTALDAEGVDRGHAQRTARLFWLVKIATRVLADSDEICITEEVYGAFAPHPVAKSETELKGISRAM
jgi:hypothetical protein